MLMGIAVPRTLLGMRTVNVIFDCNTKPRPNVELCSPNTTLLTNPRLLPIMVTLLFCPTIVGVTLLIVGGRTTWSGVVAMVLPSEFSRYTKPFTCVVKFGIVTATKVLAVCVIVAVEPFTPKKRTAVILLRLLPKINSVRPGTICVALKPVMSGCKPMIRPLTDTAVVIVAPVAFTVVAVIEPESVVGTLPLACTHIVVVCAVL